MQKHNSITNFPDSYPIIIKKELAVNFGLKEAIVLQQINFWVKYNEKRNKNFKCGRWWTYNTLEQWKEQFPFWSTTTIHSIFKKLRDSRLIFAEKLNQDPANHIMFYTINLEDDDKINLANKWLFESSPIVVSRELAHKIGLNAAIVLQQIQYWVTHNEIEKKNFFKDRYWVFNTMENWHEELPFLSISTLERTFNTLFKEGLLVKDKFNKNKFDKTNWYTINYEHKIFRDPKATLNQDLDKNMDENVPDDKNAEKPNIVDFQKMRESNASPNIVDFQKMRESEPSNFENHIVTKPTNNKLEKDARAREEFLIKNFIPANDDQDMIMQEEKLDNEQFMQAFKEYVLFCKNKYPDIARSYDMHLNGLHLWCARYHEVKKTKPKKTKTAQDSENKLMKLIDWTRENAGSCDFSTSLFEHLVNEMGSDLFIKSFMTTVKYVSCEDSVLCLKFQYIKTEHQLGVQTYCKEIIRAVKSFKDDLKAIRFLSYFDETAVEMKLDRG